MLWSAHDGSSNCIRRWLSSDGTAYLCKIESADFPQEFDFVRNSMPKKWEDEGHSNAKFEVALQVNIFNGIRSYDLNTQFYAAINYGII